jgi:hypothetical protein
LRGRCRADGECDRSRKDELGREHALSTPIPEQHARDTTVVVDDGQERQAIDDAAILDEIDFEE